MVITDVIRKRIADKIEVLRQQAVRKYEIDIPTPIIHFDLKGTRGGVHRSGHLHFNPVLLMENVETYINQTVPHEMAHHVQLLVYPESLTRMGFKKNRKVHGDDWKEIMRLFGVPANRCHSYDTSSVKRRHFVRHPAYCQCNTPHSITMKLVNKIQAGRIFRCKTCKGVVSLNKQTTVIKNLPAIQLSVGCIYDKK